MVPPFFVCEVGCCRLTERRIPGPKGTALAKLWHQPGLGAEETVSLLLWEQLSGQGLPPPTAEARHLQQSVLWEVPRQGLLLE